MVEEKTKRYPHIPLWAVMKNYHDLSIEETAKRMIKDFKLPFPHKSIQWECLMCTGDVVAVEEEARQRIKLKKARDIFKKEEEKRKYAYQERRIKEILKTLK